MKISPTWGAVLIIIAGTLFLYRVVGLEWVKRKLGVYSGIAFVILTAILLSTLSTVGWPHIVDFVTPKRIEQINILLPRHLSATQEKQLTTMLATTKGKVGFISRFMDGESADFADELATVFRDAGWDVVPTRRDSLNDFPGFVSFFVTGEGLDESANFICKTLNKSGIICKPENIQESSIGGGLEPNTVYVVVGRK